MPLSSPRLFQTGWPSAAPARRQQRRPPLPQRTNPPTMNREQSEGLAVIILEAAATIIKTIQKVRKLMAGKKAANPVKEESLTNINT